MAFNFGQWLPYIIGGGASVAGAVIGARASGKASEASAQASEAAGETQLQLSREQIKNLRDIYNLDLSLNWPRHRVATESLGNLARGMGSKLPPSTFETTDAPPELPGAGGPGAPGAPGTGAGEHGSDPLDPNSPAYHPIQTPPPGTGPSGKGAFASGAIELEQAYREQRSEALFLESAQRSGLVSGALCRGGFHAIRERPKGS